MAEGPGPDRPDALLAAIERKWADLAALHFTRGRVHQTAEYKALIKEIRALVDQWKAIHGDGMIVALEKAPGFGRDEG